MDGSKWIADFTPLPRESTASATLPDNVHVPAEPGGHVSVSGPPAVTITVGSMVFAALFEELRVLQQRRQHQQLVNALNTNSNAPAAAPAVAPAAEQGNMAAQGTAASTGSASRGSFTCAPACHWGRWARQRHVRYTFFR